MRRPPALDTSGKWSGMTYHLGIAPHRRHKGVVLLVASLVCVAAGIFLYKALHLTTAPQTIITHQGSGKTMAYNPSATARVRIQKPSFTIELPAGWTESQNLPESVYPANYIFKSVSAEARQLAIYIDRTPDTMALNKVVAVASDGSRLTYDTVSDNCAEYTRPSINSPDSGRAHAKWRGVEFICDLGNYQRNVVGTASQEGINQVTITAGNGTKHTVFMVYTDNGASPDYTVFYNMLGSFTLT